MGHDGTVYEPLLLGFLHKLYLFLFFFSVLIIHKVVANYYIPHYTTMEVGNSFSL